jgi:hypothetical protein
MHKALGLVPSPQKSVHSTPDLHPKKLKAGSQRNIYIIMLIVSSIHDSPGKGNSIVYQEKNGDMALD